MVKISRDVEYLQKLQDYYARWRSLPSYGKLCEVLGLAAVSKVLFRLKEERYLTRTPDGVWVPSLRFFERVLAEVDVPAGHPLATGDVGAEGFVVDQYLVETAYKPLLWYRSEKTKQVIGPNPWP